VDWKKRKRKWQASKDDLKNFKNSFGKKGILKSFFMILKDKKFHCRKCCNVKVKSGQAAGSGGIKGLKDGQGNLRPGIVIKSDRRHCKVHEMITYDRWTGYFSTSASAIGIPPELQRRILKVYHYTDALEGRKRAGKDLVVDHRFPKNLFKVKEESYDIKMSEAEISRNFQVLKKDEGGNHNKLKTEACNKCHAAGGKRGTPLGIKFYYKGGENWPKGVPKRGKKGEEGCDGCGWYDVLKWKKALNMKIKSKKRKSGK